MEQNKNKTEEQNMEQNKTEASMAVKGTQMNGKSEKRVSREFLLERLNRFYQCRDFELSHLWQRSIFLGAFLILAFTGYGGYFVFLMKHCDFGMLHVVGTAIALVGIIISILWIMMGKASKAWYEVYESCICDLEQREELDIEEKYRMGVYGGADKANDSLLSTASGRFSPSKINIAIGQLSLLIWFSLGTFHLSILTAALPKGPFYDILIAFSCILIFTLVIAGCLKSLLKSRTL